MNARLTSRGARLGFTLVELLVALVIGMLVVLAAVASLLGTRSASLASEDVSELQQSSARAFHLLKQHITQAGYMPIDVLDGNRGYFRVNPSDLTNVAGEPVFFAVKGTEGGPAKSDTLKLGSAPSPDFFSDCLGRAVKYDVTNPIHVDNERLVTSEFYVESGNLRCRGSGGNGTSQPIVSGVERFDVTYGVSGAVTESQIHQYVSATGVGAGEFNRVRAVRVCLQLVARSAANVSQRYVDCDGAQRTSTDGKQRGVFVSVFALRNNLGAL